MKEFIEKLIGRLDEYYDENEFETNSGFIEVCKDIVNELAEEFDGEELRKSQKIYNYIKQEINPYGKPFDGTVYEFGLKVMKYIGNLHTEELVEEYNNDFCEWEKVFDDNVDKQYKPLCSSDGFIDINGYFDYIFCPYCGKKIKVVE